MAAEQRTDERRAVSGRGIPQAYASRDPKTLDGVERRRSELLGLSFFLFVAFALGMVVLSFAPTDAFAGFGGSTNLIRLGIVALAVVFGLYVVDKHRRLRQLAHRLVNEQVVSAALVNRLRQISLLNEAGRAAMSDLTPIRAMNVILASACDLLGADDGSLLIVEDDEFELAAGYGRMELFVGQRRSITEGVAGYVYRNREPLLIQGELDMLELGSLVEEPVGRGQPVRSAISVPLEIGPRVVGILNISVSRTDRRYEEYDRATLELFAHHAAIVVLRNRTYLSGESRSETAQLERLRSDMVDRITGDLDRLTRPPPTPGDRHWDRHLKVLIVDDDPALLRILQVGLEAEGHDVTLASDGRTALERVEAEHPDVMLLDVSIPVMDGWRVMEQLRDRPDAPRAICLTAKHGRRDRIRAWQLGTAEYVTKPFEAEALIDLIASVAARSPEAQDERREEALRSLFAVG